MSIYYIASLFIGSVFWIAVIMWLAIDALPKVSAFFKKYLPAHQPTVQAVENKVEIDIEASIISHVDDQQHEELQRL